MKLPELYSFIPLEQEIEYKTKILMAAYHLSHYSDKELSKATAECFQYVFDVNNVININQDYETPDIEVDLSDEDLDSIAFVDQIVAHIEMKLHILQVTVECFQNGNFKTFQSALLTIQNYFIGNQNEQ